MLNKKHTRRDALKLLGIGALTAASPIDILLDTIVEGFVHRALAASGQLSDKRYVLVQTYGAPPRWMYDLFLKPYGGSIMPNGTVASEFSLSGRKYADAVYKTHKVKGVEAPVFWTHDVAKENGKRPVSDLMDNMLVLQGIDALNPGHGPAAALINQPLTHLSIDGALADHSKTPFGALSLGSINLNYRSNLGRGRQHFNASQAMADLLPRAFTTHISTFEKKYSAQIDNAVKKLNKASAQHKLNARNLSGDAKGAKELILGEIKNLKATYSRYLKKYEKVILETSKISKQGLKGLTDKPIGGTTRGLKYNNGGKGAKITDADIRTTLVNPTIANLAKQFALTEYVLKNNLSPSIAFNVGSLGGLKINGRNAGSGNDKHQVGAVGTTLYGVVYFRIISACLLNLIDELKATPYKESNLFDYTVIRQTGEFGRHPRPDGSGSDHAPMATNCMLLSGMIRGPVIAGEILKDGASQKYRKGSWGARGRLKNGRIATTGNVVSTLATMLDIPSPSPNNVSLVVKGSDNIVRINEAYIDKTKVKG